MPESVQQTDVAIIGAGPVGLFAVFECGMLGLKCHVIDALAAPGGQCSALYPEKPIYDIPGHPVIDAAALVAKLEQQAAPFAPHYHLDQRVEGLEPLQGGRFRLTTTRGAVIEQCKAGIVGSFPALNARPKEVLEEWLKRITGELGEYKAKNPTKKVAPFAVNQIVHSSNDRLQHDVDLCEKYKVPIQITSLRAPDDVVK